MEIIDKRIPFVLDKSILGYDMCELDAVDINVYENIIEDIICVGSTIYNNLGDIYDRLLSLCQQWGDINCINYLNSIKNQNSLSCLQVPDNFIIPTVNYITLDGGDIDFTINNNDSPYRYILIEEFITNTFGNKIIQKRTQGTQEIIFSPKIFVLNSNYNIKFMKTFIPLRTVSLNITPKPPFPDIEINNNNIILSPRTDIIYQPQSIKYRVKDQSNNYVVFDTFYENSSSFTKQSGNTYTLTVYYLNNTLIQSIKNI
jgi:hypothetical protein